MTKISETIIFFGSGPVAAASLKSLSTKFDIEAIFTKPSTKAEMQQILPQVNVFSASSKNELDSIFENSKFSSKIGVLIDYGVIVSKKIIDYFPLGIVNSHFSLLPEWRGADPITFSILSGQPTTGVSLMLVTEGMDEGPLLSQSPIAIEPSDTTPILTDKLIQASNIALENILPIYISSETHAAPQESVTIAPSKQPSYSRKLTKQDGIIDWNKPAQTIEREIRAFIEWPKSRTTLAGIDIVVTKAKVVDLTGVPGEISINGKSLVVHCGKKSLEIEKLKPAGKKEMPIQAFLAGYKNKLI